MVRDTRDVGNNLNKLWRQEDGRYLAGVHVVKTEKAQYIPTVYLARKDEKGEILTDLAMKLPAAATFEEAMAVGREWALENLPKAYKFDPNDLEIRLMREPGLG